MKNKCFAIIYGGVVDKDKLSDIHKKLYLETINNKKMYSFMSKVLNKARKTVINSNTKSQNGDLLLLLFNKERYNSKIHKIINHELTDTAEKSKDNVVRAYINDSRDANKYIYLSSSHNDCAEDHKPYQGKLYYDDKAPQEIVEWCKSKGMMSIQWVMGAPAWFITRPNCRHYFKSLNTDVVKKYSKKELIHRYKTHNKEGNKDLATPRHVVIEEYSDRLQMLKGMYSKHPTEMLRRHIQKTKLLLDKWRHAM